jgi:electron transfer flavoprotein alpha subunit
MKLFVFIQHEEEKINPVSLEALRGAQEIAEKSGGTVSAVTFSSSAGAKLTGYDLGEILVIENPQLENYNPLYYVKALEDVTKSESCNILIFGHSYEARDWVPRLSARLDIPLISDCIGFKNDGGLTFVRSVYQGKCNSDLSVSCEKFILSFQSGAFRVDTLKTGSASIRNVSVDLSDVKDSILPGEKFQESETSVDLTQADIIVSVGRGIAKEENLQMVRDLAAAIGGEMASSRPVVDSGWLEPYHQVGSSGQTVSPKLYLALGISGAIQHIVGMKGSKNIVVINKDQNAPLFEIADYGVVGDLFEIVPNLITAIQDS